MVTYPTPSRYSLGQMMGTYERMTSGCVWMDGKSQYAKADQELQAVCNEAHRPYVKKLKGQDN